MLRKAVWGLLVVFLLANNAFAQTQMVPGVQEISLSANNTAAPQTGTAFSISSNLTTFTWIISFASTPASHTTVLQFSNDNSTWQTLDTSTNVNGETRTVFSAARFVRAVESARTGGSSITVTIVGKGGPVTILTSGANGVIAADGSIASPGFSFTNETNSGLYRAGAGDVRLSVLGVDRITVQNNSLGVSLRGTDGGAYFRAGTAGTDINSSPLTISNGGTPKFQIPAIGATSGQIIFANGNASTGVGIDLVTDGVIKFRDRASFTADATVQAGIFQTSAAWIAGVSGSNTYFGDPALPSRVRTSMATPSSLTNGDWWVESDTGAVTGASGALKAQLNGSTVFVSPSIRRVGRVNAQTNSSVGTLATYTVGAVDGSFEVSSNVLVTTATTHTFTIECAYTDESNTARTVTMSFRLVASPTTITTSITNTNGAVPYNGEVLHIRAKAATTILIRTQAAGTYTTVVYNAEGIIRQIS